VAGLDTPAEFIYVHHTAGSLPDGPSHAARAAKMRQLQQAAFGEGYSDIEYSFVFFMPDGACYEGRGWGRVGGHTGGGNGNYNGHGLCTVGNFMTMHPSDDLLAAYANVIERGIEVGAVNNSPTILGHRDVGTTGGGATACPGTHLYAALPKIRADVGGDEMEPDVQRAVELTIGLRKKLRKKASDPLVPVEQVADRVGRATEFVERNLMGPAGEAREYPEPDQPADGAIAEPHDHSDDS
jgi:hypothetical protein